MWRWSMEVSGEFPAPKAVTWAGLYLLMGGRMFTVSRRYNPRLLDWLLAFDVPVRFLDRDCPWFDHGEMAAYESEEADKPGFLICTRDYLLDRIMPSGQFAYAFLNRFYLVTLPDTTRVRRVYPDSLDRIRRAMPERMVEVDPPAPWPEDGAGWRHPYAKRHGLVVNHHRHRLLKALCAIQGLAAPMALDLEMTDWLYRTSAGYFLRMLESYLEVQREADIMAAALADPRRGTSRA